MRIDNLTVRSVINDLLGARRVADLENDGTLHLCETVADDGMFVVATDTMTIVASAWQPVRPTAAYVSFYDWANDGKRVVNVVTNGNVRDLVESVLIKAGIAF